MYDILDKIENIDDIKKLELGELEKLSVDVRDKIVDVTSKNGGHVASSLGVVELTIALLRVFDFKKDKIVWDVGHQSYAYKILTDRKDRFDTIRTYEGISGFPRRKESKFDFFDTGHSSTSISAGLGMCVARDLNKDDYKVVAVIGDGALTGGMAFEALENLSLLKSNYIIILNDNEMSISKNNGGLNKALLGVRTSNRYMGIKKSLKENLEKTYIGMFVKNVLITIVNMIKQIIEREGMLFETLNVNYVGPIDGHDIKALEKTLQNAKKMNEPIIIHIKTKKGKGYKPAEENPTLFHGISPYDKETGAVIKKSDKPTYTKVFSDTLVELADMNKKIVAITAAMANGTGLDKFEKKYKDRFFDVGICEQHAITFAAGLATSGLIPVVAIYSTFLQRAIDQVITDVALQNLHVVFAIDRAGLVGADGETHQGMFDISYLRMIPNMTILAPKNANELKSMIRYAINDIKGPVAIRYPRGIVYDKLVEFDNKVELGKAEILSDEDEFDINKIGDKKKIAIFAIGTQVSTAINLKEKLLEKENAHVIVVNARFAKPIDYEMIDKICENYDMLVVMEETVSAGGIGEAIEKYVGEKYSDKKIKIKSISLPDDFIEHGDVDMLRKKLKIDSDDIMKNLI